MPENMPRSSYKKKRKRFDGLRPQERVRPQEGDREVITLSTEQSNISTIVVPNKTNSKAFQISVS